MLYYFKKGKDATEMQKKICAVYGEGVVTNWTCQSGLRTFLVLLTFGQIILWGLFYALEGILAAPLASTH